MFKSRGVDATIWPAHGGEVLEQARRAAQSDAPVVVAGGGDGTVSTVASQLVGGDKPLGVLPLGTLNHFAKDLHIPLELGEALDVIVARNTTLIDVGEVNGRFFVNNSGLGLYPQMVALRAQHQARGWNKWLALLSAMMIIFHRFPLLTVHLDADGRELLRRTRMVFIGNNEYELQGLQMGSRPCLDAGRLFLYVIRQTSRWGLLRMGLHALLRKLHELKEFDAMCVNELSVQAKRRRLHVALDGEVVALEPPLRYRSRPAALRVIVPSRAPDAC